MTRRAPSTKDTKTRVRRRPEEARRLILDAARELFASHGPDAVGLKDVAERAEISHGLITHYFGTYDALVEATFADHVERARAKVLDRVRAIATERLTSSPPRKMSDARAWVELAAEHVGDPLYGRLLAWGLLSGRFDAEDSFPARTQGLRHATELMVETLRSGGHHVAREDVEFALMLTMTALSGYALGRRALWLSLGKKVSDERDRWFKEKLALVLERLIESEKPAKATR